jgi:hypothetical protein
MQFQVPQFIDIEDKIIGPLTLRQFIYLAIAGGIIFIFYFLVNFVAWILISLIFAGLGVALAFLKINGQPFQKVLLNMINFYLKPQTYVWLKEEPQTPKTSEEIHKKFSYNFNLINSLEKIISGFSLKQAQQKVLTGTSPNAKKTKIIFETNKERYELFKKISGERKVARRIDYS